MVSSHAIHLVLSDVRPLDRSDCRLLLHAGLPEYEYLAPLGASSDGQCNPAIFLLLARNVSGQSKNSITYATTYIGWAAGNTIAREIFTFISHASPMTDSISAIVPKQVGAAIHQFSVYSLGLV